VVDACRVGCLSQFGYTLANGPRDAAALPNRPLICGSSDDGCSSQLSCQRNHFFLVDRLGDEAIGRGHMRARAEEMFGVTRPARSSYARDKDYGDTAEFWPRPDVSIEPGPTGFGHGEIESNQVGPFLFDRQKGLFTVAGTAYEEPIACRSPPAGKRRIHRPSTGGRSIAHSATCALPLVLA
jgi:hypothetical protein